MKNINKVTCDEQFYVDLLHSLHTGLITHTEDGRPLFDHLYGTYSLLKNWGNPVNVCLAGLFHSIYGTRLFNTITVPLELRSQVIWALGEDVEKLVYIFCFSDRKSLFGQKSNEPVVLQLGKKEKIEISHFELRCLIEIEFANILDQLPHSRNVTKKAFDHYDEKFRQMKGWISESAYSNFVTVFGAYRVKHYKTLPD